MTELVKKPRPVEEIEEALERQQRKKKPKKTITF